MPWNDDQPPFNSDEDGPRRPNPWGKPQKDSGRDDGHPYRNRRPDGPGDVDLDEMLKGIRNNFGKMFPEGGHTGRYITGFLALLVAIWMLSGIYFIQPNENGVVLSFGKFTRTDETPGIKWKLPWPFQTVNIIDVTTERRIQIGYNGAPDARSANNAHNESLMLTGDENIVDINFVVLWRVQDAKDFMFSIRDPEDTINLVAASAMREIIGQTNIQPALTDARTRIQTDARALMQKLLDEYHAGVTINNVQLQKVDPPAAVVDAFNEVQRARQEKEKLKNEAEAYRNGILPRAKGEAERLKQDAEAYKQEVVNRAIGDAKRFDSVYQAYTSAKDVTAERMYLETVESILKNAHTVVMSNNGSNVVPLLPLNNTAAPAVPKAPAAIDDTQ